MIDSYKDIFAALQIDSNEDRLRFIYVTELPQMNTDIKTFIGFK